MPSLTHPNANATLSYSGTNLARVRCRELVITYTLNSAESHARQHRAFYPHRRSQGGFTTRLECNGWAEFNALSNWFRAYAQVALDLGNAVPPPMTVSVPSRSFQRLGIPTKGIEHGDFLGSMVFDPTISFVSVSDPADASTGILDTTQASATDMRKTDPTAVSYFYPGSDVNYPGKLSDKLYDVDQRELQAAQNIQNEIQNEVTADRELNRINSLNRKMAMLDEL